MFHLGLEVDGFEVFFEERGNGGVDSSFDHGGQKMVEKLLDERETWLQVYKHSRSRNIIVPLPVQCHAPHIY